MLVFWHFIVSAAGNPYLSSKCLALLKDSSEKERDINGSVIYESLFDWLLFGGGGGG